MVANAIREGKLILPPSGAGALDRGISPTVAPRRLDPVAIKVNVLMLDLEQLLAFRQAYRPA